MNEIAILLCSRGRPEQLKRMIDSASLSADDPLSLQFYVRLDSDDPTLLAYSQLEYAQDCYREYILGEREGNIKPYNGLIKQIFTDAPEVMSVMIAADDVVFHTQGWDTRIRDLNEITKLYLMYFWDGKVGSICASHPVISRELAVRLDYQLLDPDYVCFKADQHLTDVCKRANISYYDKEVYVEHLHPKYDKADWDTTYVENRPAWCVNEDQERFDAKEELRTKQVQQILGVK